jgi:hypothetical protein
MVTIGFGCMDFGLSRFSSTAWLVTVCVCVNVRLGMKIETCTITQDLRWLLFLFLSSCECLSMNVFVRE